MAKFQFDDLPDSAFLRIAQLAQFVGVSVPTIWRLVAAGTFPAPIRILPRETTWRVGDVQAYLDNPALAGPFARPVSPGRRSPPDAWPQWGISPAPRPIPLPAHQDAAAMGTGRHAAVRSGLRNSPRTLPPLASTSVNTWHRMIVRKVFSKDQIRRQIGRCDGGNDVRGWRGGPAGCIQSMRIVMAVRRKVLLTSRARRAVGAQGLCAVTP